MNLFAGHGRRVGAAALISCGGIDLPLLIDRPAERTGNRARQLAEKLLERGNSGGGEIRPRVHARATAASDHRPEQRTDRRAARRPRPDDRAWSRRAGGHQTTIDPRSAHHKFRPGVRAPLWGRAHTGLCLAAHALLPPVPPTLSPTLASRARSQPLTKPPRLTERATHDGRRPNAPQECPFDVCSRSHKGEDLERRMLRRGGSGHAKTSGDGAASPSTDGASRVSVSACATQWLIGRSLALPRLMS